MTSIGFSIKKQRIIHNAAIIYWREAKKCRASKLYLSGCILIGASLEGMLLAALNCFDFLLEDLKCSPKYKGSVKKLDEWKFQELINAANELGWLPVGLTPDDDWDNAKAQIGDYVGVVKYIRNLIHPVRYAEFMGKKRVTKKYLDACFNILQTATIQIDKMLHLTLSEIIRINKMKKHPTRACS